MATPKYMFINPRLQRFSLPYDMILKMTKNPCSSMGYEKLLKTSKWFFATSQILPISSIVLINNFGWWDSAIGNNTAIGFTKIDYKIWLTDKLICYTILSEFFLAFKSKLYRCDAHIVFKGHVLLDVLKGFLTLPFIKKLTLNSIYVKENDGSLVSISDVLDALPNGYSVLYTHGSDPFAFNMEIKPESENDFVIWRFRELSNKFDVKSIYNVAKNRKNNQDVNLYFTFIFHYLTENYTNELNNFVENIIEECKISKIFPPMFTFPAFQKKLLNELQDLRYNYKRQKLTS